jgi:hypothetical protein
MSNKVSLLRQEPASSKLRKAVGSFHTIMRPLHACATYNASLGVLSSRLTDKWDTNEVAFGDAFGTNLLIVLVKEQVNPRHIHISTSIQDAMDGWMDRNIFDVVPYILPFGSHRRSLEGPIG